MQRDCPELNRIGTIRLWFPHEATVRVAVTPRSLRDMFGMQQFLRTLPEMEPTVEGSNQFSSNGNALQIDYGERDDIVITLQDGQSSAESLIHVVPTRIKIASKYSILTNELYEDSLRDGTGTRSMVIPDAPVHVLLISPTLFQSTVCLQVNEHRYYLDWREILFDNEMRQTVIVQSQYGYRHRVATADRQLVADPLEYFRGRVPIPSPPPQLQVPIVAIYPIDEPVAEATDQNNTPPNEAIANQLPTEDAEEEASSQDMPADMALLFDEQFALPENIPLPVNDNGATDSDENELVIDEAETDESALEA